MRLRHVKTAKRWILRVDPARGPSLTVPGGAEARAVRAFLMEREDWLRDRLAGVQLDFLRAKQGRGGFHHQGGAVFEAVDSRDPAALRAAAARLAREQLPARFEAMQARMHAALDGRVPPVTRLTLRPMRSRWGSCGAGGRISLNTHLIFLPRDWQEHVILHELCHLVHLNHSPRFWSLLESLDPQTPRIRRQLRQASALVPHWA